MTTKINGQTDLFVDGAKFWILEAVIANIILFRTARKPTQVLAVNGCLCCPAMQLLQLFEKDRTQFELRFAHL
jgi:hypothetical protein